MIEGLEPFLVKIGPGPRAALLRMLEASDAERAALIGRLYQAKGGGDFSELMLLLEEREWARQFVIEELRHWPEEGEE